MLLNESWTDWRREQEFKKFDEGVKAQLAVNYRYIIGVDLAKLRDKTVLTVLESEITKSGEAHCVKDIRVLPGGLSYLLQAAQIAAYCDKPCFRTWGVKVVVDASGIGQPVSDILKETHGLKHSKITVTSGDSKNGNNVSRNYLIRTLLKWLGQPNFFISSDIAEADRLREELESLSIEYRKDGSASFYAGEHDDCIMSLALCTLQLERSKSVSCGVTDIFLNRDRG